MRKGIPKTVLAGMLLVVAAAAAAQENAGELIDQADRLLQKEGASPATVDAYRAVFQRYGDSEHAARARYMAAECLYQLGDLAAARDGYRHVRGASGATPVLAACAELRQGQCDFAAGEFEAARKHFRTVVDDFDDTYLARDARFALAQTLVALNDWETFREVADELTERWPGYAERPEIRFAYGVYHWELGGLAEAKEHFRHVESERARFYYARCLAAEGQHLQAVQQFRQLLVRYPRTPLAEDVRFAIAESFLHSGQRGLASKAFQELLRKHPDGTHARAARFKLATIQYREEDYTRTLESLDALANDLPAEDSLHEKVAMLRGLTHFKLGRESEADQAFSLVLQRFPEGRASSAALFRMIHNYARRENWNQSRGMSLMFADRYAGDPLAGRVQLLHALACLELGEMVEARQHLGKLLDQHSGTDLGEKALFLLTWSYHREHDLSRIVTNYRHLARKLLPTPNPWRARTYYLIAESYFQLGLYQDAADLYRLVLNDYPFSDAAPYALQGMTASYSHLGDDQRAALEQERYLLVISNEAGDNPANALAAAGMYYNRKEYKKALELFESFLAAMPEAPEHAEALYQSGECLYSLQYYDDAVRRWERVLGEHPDYASTPEVLFKLADTLFGLQRYGEAHARFTELVERFPEHRFAEEALFNAANCLYNRKDYDSAVRAFERYTAAYPEGLRLADAEQAIHACFLRSGRDLLEYVEQNPDAVFAAEVLWQKGSEAFAAQRWQEAADHFETITLRYPDSESAPDALYYLAESRFSLGLHGPSLAAFQNYAATYPDRELVPAALLKSGHILYLQENYAEAAGNFLVLSDQYPGSDLAPLGLYNAGLGFRKLEQWQSFLGNGEEFLRRFAGHERRLEVLMQMAEVHQNETGQPEEALALWDQVLAEPGAPADQVQYQRGECLLKLGRADEAETALRLAAAAPGAMDGDFGVAALARLASHLEEGGRLADAREVYRQIAGEAGNQEWAALAAERVQALNAELQAADGHE